MTTVPKHHSAHITVGPIFTTHGHAYNASNLAHLCCDYVTLLSLKRRSLSSSAFDLFDATAVMSSAMLRS
jgi:hypothetical protein